MDGNELTKSDYDLIESAKETLAEYFDPGRLRTACSLRTASGSVYSSINLIPATGAAGVHCEPIAVGMAVMEGETDFETSVAVTYPDENPSNDPIVVSACGICRELYREFAPDIDIIVPGGKGPIKVPLPDLLPARD